MSQPMHTLLTHSGAFHSDELMALVLLQRFYLLRPTRVVHGLGTAATLALLERGQQPSWPPLLLADGTLDARTPCAIVRSRDAAVLEAAKSNPEVFVIDVGGSFSPDKLNFDHHQESMRQAWPDGTAFSSTGLIWRWLRGQGLLDAVLGAEIADELERTLIIPLDAHDNGQAVCETAQVCEAFNRNNEKTEVVSAQFEKALAFLNDVFDNHRHLAHTKVEARRTLERAWAARSEGDVHVVLDAPLPYSDGTGLLKALSDDKALVLAIPGKGNRYNIISVRGDTPFSSKCPVPESWRGRMDFDVVLEGKAHRVAFAHKSGFMCVLEGDREQADRLARHVVTQHLAVPDPPARRSSGP